MFGFYRVAAATPELTIADVDFNVKRISQLIKEAEDKSAAVVVFPELAVTGYTCADIFHQATLLNKAEQAVILFHSPGTILLHDFLIDIA